MQRELMSYHDPLTVGVVDIFDLTEARATGNDPPTSILPEAHPMPPSAFLVSIPPFTATGHEWLRHAAKRWETTNVLIPVRVTEEHFEQLIDLRVPHVAAWFTQNLALSHFRW